MISLVKRTLGRSIMSRSFLEFLLPRYNSIFAVKALISTGCVMQILVVVFGQELPDATANLVDQVFSLAVALIGLGTFALVLALVEQVVLEVSVHDCLKVLQSR